MWFRNSLTYLYLFRVLRILVAFKKFEIYNSQILCLFFRDEIKMVCTSLTLGISHSFLLFRKFDYYLLFYENGKYL